jgi:hypothetical protein
MASIDPSSSNPSPSAGATTASDFSAIECLGLAAVSRSWYDEANDQLTMTEQRGDWVPFGGSVLTRIEPQASPDASPNVSASP